MSGYISRLPGVVAVVLALVFLGGCMAQLYGDLSEEEANIVLAALLENGLAAEKRAGVEGAFIVMVEEADFAQAVQVLDGRGLPARRFDDLGKVFGKVAMFATPLEEKARFLYAMQEELAQTISNIDGVLTARVHLVLPEQDQLGRSIQSPSAAVFVRHADDDRHDPVGQRRDIRQLVAAAVPNLDVERIVVSFFAATPSVVLPRTPQQYETVFGVTMSRQSVTRFWWILGGAGGIVILALAATAIALARRGRK